MVGGTGTGTIGQATHEGRDNPGSSGAAPGRTPMRGQARGRRGWPLRTAPTHKLLTALRFVEERADTDERQAHQVGCGRVGAVPGGSPPLARRSAVVGHRCWSSTHGRSDAPHQGPFSELSQPLLRPVGGADNLVVHASERGLPLQRGPRRQPKTAGPRSHLCGNPCRSGRLKEPCRHPRKAGARRHRRKGRWDQLPRCRNMRRIIATAIHLPAVYKLWCCSNM